MVSIVEVTKKKLSFLFSTLIFGDNSYFINFSKICSRRKFCWRISANFTKNQAYKTLQIKSDNPLMHSLGEPDRLPNAN